MSSSHLCGGGSGKKEERVILGREASLTSVVDSIVRGDGNRMGEGEEGMVRNWFSNSGGRFRDLADSGWVRVRVTDSSGLGQSEVGVPPLQTGAEVGPLGIRSQRGSNPQGEGLRRRAQVWQHRSG